MAKQTLEIQTESFIRIGGNLVNTEDLNEKQRIVFATRLGIAYLNKLFQGKAEFWSDELPTEDVFATLREQN